MDFVDSAQSPVHYRVSAVPLRRRSPSKLAPGAVATSECDCVLPAQLNFPIRCIVFHVFGSPRGPSDFPVKLIHFVNSGFFYRCLCGSPCLFYYFVCDGASSFMKYSVARTFCTPCEIPFDVPRPPRSTGMACRCSVFRSPIGTLARYTFCFVLAFVHILPTSGPRYSIDRFPGLIPGRSSLLSDLFSTHRRIAS